MKYDDASWHYGGEFPAGLPQSAGATHIAMFLAWAALKGLASDRIAADPTAELHRLASRALTPGQWFSGLCDEVFTDEDLSPEGNAFADHYYERSYAADYAAAFPRAGFYAVENTWASYDALRATLDRRFADWRKKRRPAK